MAEQTGIAWCDHTFNAWIGCTKVSAACDFCYAEALMDHRYARVKWGGERVLTGDANWRQPHRWNRAAGKAGVRRKVFCLSLGDVFDNQVAVEWRHELWRLIYECNNLDWLLLTKRPQNIMKMLPGARYPEDPTDTDWPEPWPWPHVWLGTTAENQQEYDRRYPALLAVPAAVHFISYEPALEPLTIAGREPLPDWIICGGESGQQARPFDVTWARDMRDQCLSANVPFFMKQFGSASVGVSGITGKGDDPTEWPADLRIRQFPIAEGRA